MNDPIALHQHVQAGYRDLIVLLSAEDPNSDEIAALVADLDLRVAAAAAVFAGSPGSNTAFAETQRLHGECQRLAEERRDLLGGELQALGKVAVRNRVGLRAYAGDGGDARFLDERR